MLEVLPEIRERAQVVEGCISERVRDGNGSGPKFGAGLRRTVEHLVKPPQSVSVPVEL